jgi:hypothetical protein
MSKAKIWNLSAKEVLDACAGKEVPDEVPAPAPKLGECGRPGCVICEGRRVDPEPDPCDLKVKAGPLLSADPWPEAIDDVNKDPGTVTADGNIIIRENADFEKDLKVGRDLVVEGNLAVVGELKVAGKVLMDPQPKDSPLGPDEVILGPTELRALEIAINLADDPNLLCQQLGMPLKEATEVIESLRRKLT